MRDREREPRQPVRLGQDVVLVRLVLDTFVELERLLPPDLELGVCRQLDDARELGRSILKLAVPPPDGLATQLRTPGRDQALAGAERVVDAGPGLTNANALDEPQLRLEGRTELLVLGRPVKVSPGTPDLVVTRVAPDLRSAQAERVARCGREAGFGLRDLAGHDPGGPELEARVRRIDPVEVARQLAVAGEQAERGLARKVALDPDHARVRALAVERVAERNASGPLVVHEESADHPWTLLAGEPSASARLCEAAGEEQLDRGLEVAGVLDEERTLLRELDLEALVGGHLRLVGLDLAEVRLDRDVHGDGVLHHRLDVGSIALLPRAAECRDVEVLV